ncbi:protein PYRICULARIA ORYZAE RESISTANCE 21-like [Rhododendron vialii]|uniref:protein PYRICULARIA ORYZAE RESISTANCE 21-like n=1 Tax=Rhododendron vialii TaxID=182163 RepID=UPI00265F8261|nr:protein PYRICULARIA ORYZAE RESISTANCE 21-like [Rhododendron vialii]
MAEKVTTMVLKVDLQCPCCYRKIKKVLAKFPEIRSQAYDEKQNTVTITVLCCSPEKIRDKLCCKGGKTIKCIEIKPPPKPDPKPCPPHPVYVPVLVCCGQCCRGIPRGPCYEGCGRPVPSCDGGCGGNRACYGVSRCNEYFNEENTSGCTIM